MPLPLGTDDKAAANDVSNSLVDRQRYNSTRNKFAPSIWMATHIMKTVSLTFRPVPSSNRDLISVKARSHNTFTPVTFIISLFLLFAPLDGSAREVSKCLSYAQTYYETLYCEIASSGRRSKLPNFTDFQKNSEITQALLLKPHAQALRIPISLPSRSAKMREPQQSVSVDEPKVVEISRDPQTSPKQRLETATNEASQCTYDKSSIHCGGMTFNQVTNKQNNALQRDALSRNNTLTLPFIESSPQDDNFEFYLTEAYLVYLDKMMSIGLGGVTMTYSKFYFLYLDLLRRNVDFNQRFSTMFEFLKKDKHSLGVSSRPAKLSMLSDKQCSRARSSLFICELGGRNYLFN